MRLEKPLLAGCVALFLLLSGVRAWDHAIPGYDEVVRDGVDGLLVPPGDPPALAAGLERVLSDTDLARRLGESARERAREFSWERVAAQLESVYEPIVS